MNIETNTGDAEFDEFNDGTTVEVGVPDGAEPKKEEPKKGPKPAAKAPPADDDDDGDDTGDEGGDDEGEEGDEEGADDKPKKTARDHQIERLKREKADLRRQLREGANAGLSARLENIEKALSGENTGDTKATGKAAPDPSDTEKYPLGHLDDRYIEDKLEWLADKKATEQADSVLQRQQENERNQAATAAQKELLGKVDTLAAKGSDLYDDFQETVVDTGLRGDWKLTQTTFEAAHDAENGAQILYELANDPDEAARVAGLPPLKQLKFVLDRDAEIGTKKPRTKPKAGEPPKNAPRGANSKTEINPATDDLGEFEKAWKRDEKRGRG